VYQKGARQRKAYTNSKFLTDYNSPLLAIYTCHESKAFRLELYQELGKNAA
jgi:hypothetical protein